MSDKLIPHDRVPEPNLDGAHLHLELGQAMIPHGPDRDLTVAEAVRPANGQGQ